MRGVTWNRLMVYWGIGPLRCQKREGDEKKDESFSRTRGLSGHYRSKWLLAFIASTLRGNIVGGRTFHPPSFLSRTHIDDNVNKYSNAGREQKH